MEQHLVSQIFIGVIGGLGLFLLGMKQMSDGMQAVAGERLRKLIRAVTDNRLIACGVGASITGIVQSSSVTTVMVVGMVNAGLMTLKQAAGVIMGTNIGTTITAWLIALHLADYGLPILGISALIFLFSKNQKLQYTAMVFLGLGMVFFGLELMKGGLKPLRSLPAFIHMMAAFEPTSFSGLIKCVITGALLTAIVQSSSATVAITITLASTGSITYPTAVALVLGENIGTTITAFLASLGTNTNAKRAAFAHILFNIIGVTIMIPLFHQYVKILELAFPETLPIASRIAFSHSFFNIFVVLLLLPLLSPFTKFVAYIIRGKTIKEKSHLSYIDTRIYETPAIGIQQSLQEIVQMGHDSLKMMDWLKESISNETVPKTLENKIFLSEQNIDLVQKEVVEFIGKMMTGNLSRDFTSEARKQLRMADEYETISDYVTSILKLRCRLRNSELKFSDIDLKEILEVHTMVDEYIRFVLTAVERQDKEILSEAMAEGNAVTHKVKTIRSNHLGRLVNNETSALFNLIYMDMLTDYRRIKDHSFNIAEVLVGEK